MQYAAAEPLLLEGFDGMKRFDADVPADIAKRRLAGTAERLAQLYDATNRPAEAAKWRAERLKYLPEPAPPPRPAKP